MIFIYYILFIIGWGSTLSIAQDIDCVYGDCQDGFGELVTLDGQSYVGTFKSGRFEGYGIFIWDTQRKYIGYWKRGFLDGKGTLIYGEKELSGYWAKNRFVSRNKTINHTSEHGHFQLKMMIQSMPKLETCLDSLVDLKRWIIDQFNGASIGQPISWMESGPAEDSFPFHACHVYPTATQSAKVWVRPCKEPMAFLAYLCFEFHNIQSYKLFNALDEDAKMFRCTKEEYIHQFAQLEFQAAHRTARFFNEKLASKPGLNHFKNNEQWWYVYMPLEFEDWKSTWRDTSYPHIPFASFYDRMIKGIIHKY